MQKLKQNQPEVVKIIENSYQKDKLVHAYLFEGDKGTMKFQAALYFAAILLCTNEKSKPCGECLNCKRVFSGQHSNIYLVEPFNGIIRKDQIESLIRELSSTSLEEGSRVFIINDAEMMNSSAANALLKFLEEPFPNQYLILLSTQPQLLLSTIRSRVQEIHFKPFSILKMEQLLKEKGVNPDIAYIIANMTSSLEEADKIINSGLITDIIDLVKILQKAKTQKKDMYVEFIKNGKFLFQGTNDYPLHETFFEILMLFVREKIKYLLKVEEVHLNDIMESVDFHIENQENLIKQLETLSEHQERMKFHVNMELLYASLFLEL